MVAHNNFGTHKDSLQRSGLDLSLCASIVMLVQLIGHGTSELTPLYIVQQWDLRKCYTATMITKKFLGTTVH